MKAIKMKSPNNGETGNLLSPDKALGTGIGFYLIELLPKSALWEFPNKPGCCQDYRLLTTN